ncbi:hypothetical protein INS49_015781 [Diaporthe citri]|uniref:uncharacterized protein n=1 Tax=Diaporthe citri TaxID=83186 RepID=UPI001C7E53CC|nr:uncharacterized protein INS49_015781 [Diaporthe citri]KAG6356393.1 hypothetical protein INS49_015781 [Diaporthe citri]
MCFGDSSKNRRSAQARPVELRPPVPRGIRHPETLEELGYVVYPAGIDDISAIPSGPGQAIDLYTIYHVDRVFQGQNIALLGAREETGLLLVYEIYTVRDPRHWSERPRAAAIFLSFWHRFLGQRIELLRTILFQTVTERTTDVLRRKVYRKMGYHLWEDLDIQRGGRRQGEVDSFDQTCDESKFGKGMRLMETENQAMKDAGIHIYFLKFRPHDDSGVFYNFVVEFRAPSSRHHQGGRRRRH